jgi:hypothetical protein
MPSKFVQISDYKSQEEKLSIHIAVDRIDSSRVNCMNGTNISANTKYILLTILDYVKYYTLQ